jgi:hypothetical protein
MSSLLLFKMLVAAHIVTGASGLVSFWVPVAGRKGGASHRKWGRVFTWLMIVTGSIAVGISLCTVTAPLETHPHLAGHAQFGDPRMITAVFGWMMLYLAVLTVNLAWYGRLCVTNKRNHRANRAWHNLLLQGLLTAAAVNCAWQGWRVGMPLMIGIAFVGFATVITNLNFMLRDRPGPQAWLLEHIKALVGAGISVYTAFFAFGAVRLVPALALTPVLWSIPLVVGLALIVVHQRRVLRAAPRPA